MPAARTTCVLQRMASSLRLCGGKTTATHTPRGETPWYTRDSLPRGRCPQRQQRGGGEGGGDREADRVAGRGRQCAEARRADAEPRVVRHAPQRGHRAVSLLRYRIQHHGEARGLQRPETATE